MSEAIMPLVCGPLYSVVYKLTINAFPGFFFLLGIGFSLPAACIFL